MNPNEILNESGQNTPRVAYFPVSFFSVIMGLSGFTLAWKGADNLFFHNSAIWLCLAYVTSISMAVISIIYLITIETQLASTGVVALEPYDSRS